MAMRVRFRYNLSGVSGKIRMAVDIKPRPSSSVCQISEVNLPFPEVNLFMQLFLIPEVHVPLVNLTIPCFIHSIDVRWVIRNSP